MVDNNKSFTLSEFQRLSWNGLNDNSFFRGSDGLIYRRVSASIAVDNIDVNTQSVDTSGLIGKSTGKSDFTIAYASGTTLTLGNYADGSTLVVQDIESIRVLSTAGAVIQEKNRDELTLSISGSTLTVTGFDAAFGATDEFVIYTNVPRNPAYDSGLDINKIIDQAPLWSRYTDKIALISAAQELDATPTDSGSEIDMRGYNQLGIWGTVDIGTSTNFQLRVLLKHTSAGTEEYRECSLTVGSPAATQTSINYNDYIVTPNADGLFFLPINVGNLVPYVQLQVFDAADGDGQLDALYVTKAWSPAL